MRVYAERYKYKTGVKKEEYEITGISLEEAIVRAKSLRKEYTRVIVINDNSMSDKLFLDALKRMKERIEAGLPLVFWDDTTIGAKETHCSWGLCSIDSEQWPDSEYHTWPLQYLKEGRISTVCRQPDQFCVFDDDTKCNELEDASAGCFYRCRIFQEEFRPTRVQVVELYDIKIKEMVGH